ncbi:hypothetical protein AZF01_22465 (plasmid) [Martelella sp. AD-3]|uniref:hypothetical protein n=1 Tax=Martelella sp. AD-3 TaxID=686597 RepID=UPI0004661ADD|nr:hypothetical protein [Martelella sp. AD-3]AMM87276.1 hypothetical protein AZF01_22465 [Martelella sp. AD-3]
MQEQADRVLARSMHDAAQQKVDEGKVSYDGVRRLLPRPVFTKKEDMKIPRYLRPVRDRKNYEAGVGERAVRQLVCWPIILLLCLPAAAVMPQSEMALGFTVVSWKIWYNIYISYYSTFELSHVPARRPH